MNLFNVKYLILEDEEPIAIRLKEDIIRWEKEIRHNTAFTIDIACSSSEAIHLYLAKKHDVLFLDIELGNHNGYDHFLGVLLRRAQQLPYTVITSGSPKRKELYYDKQPLYAPYILDRWDKPFFERTQECLDLLFMKIDQIEHHSNSLSPTRGALLIQGTGHNVTKCFFDDIVYLAANGNETKFYLFSKNEIEIYPKNMGYYEQKLPGTGFYRIGKFFIINDQYFKSLEGKSKNYRCYFTNDTYINVPYTQLNAFKKYIENKF